MSEDKKTLEKKDAPPAPSPPAMAIVLPKAPEGQMTLRVNGKDHFIDPKKHRNLIAALRDLGYDIPHFCYHPGLEPDGNCRMCFVNLVDTRSGKPMLGPNLSTQPWELYPKPVISCQQPLDPRGMVVETETPEVLEARRWIMEFMLINHPLDCPVCDKAGECMLQDHSYAHGKAGSRYQEAKNEKAPKELGPTISLWTDRCIMCRRCVRFLREVTGTAELYISERGDRSEISIMPGHAVDNPLMGNIVDLCPVGALIDQDLKYSYRSWYLQRTDSLCPACSKGCNIQVHAQQYVRRLVPRANEAVNGWWMCDRGRKDFRYIHSDLRVMRGRVGGEAVPVLAAAEAAGVALAAAARADAGSVACLASAWLSLEEMHCLKALFNEVFKSDRIGLLSEPDGEEQSFPRFKVEKDRNPNRAGARLVFGAEVEARTDELIRALWSGAVKAVYVVSSMPHYEPPAELLEALGKVDTVVVQDVLQGPLAGKADILLPGSSFAEKDGAFINGAGRVQVLRRAVDPLGQGLDDLALVQRVACAAGSEAKMLSAREVFRRMSLAYPSLAGMTHVGLGRLGGEGKTATGEPSGEGRS